MKMGPDGWKELAEADSKPDSKPRNPHIERARRVFLAEYDLPELRTRHKVSRLTARDWSRASKANRIPDWVFQLAPIPDLRAAAEADRKAGER